MRQTYVRPAGPPCLWPDRPPALELTKLLNGGKGCSRRKHGYRKESGSRALLAFLAGRGAAAENMDTEKNLEAALFSLFWREGVQPQKTRLYWKPRSSRFSGGKGCSRRKHGYRKESGSRALLAFLAGRGAAAENMDTEKNLEAALFSLFWREGVQPQKTWTEKNLEAALFSLFWREGVQPQKTWIQKRIWKPRSSRFSGGKGCSRRKHGYRKESGSRALLAFLAGSYRKESGSRALLAFLAGRGAAAENMDTEKNLEAALFSLFWREGVQPQKTWIQKRIWKPRSSRFPREGVQPHWIQKRIKPRSSRFSGGRGAAAENISRALLAFLAGRGAAAENMDTEKNLEAALFSLFWREGVQPQKTWIQKRIWKPRSSRFSSPTSIVCQGLVQTGLALHPMSRNRWSLEISSLKMFRLQCGLFLTQDVSPAVWRWRLLNARCFACSFWMAPSCLPFEHCNINFSCHSNIALWSAIL